MKIYINPEAEFPGQISAVVRDDDGKFLGCTKLQNIPKGATEEEINEMKRKALADARNGNYTDW